jgi:DNA-binding LacI/PurR family transcriptional regulator
MNISRMHGAELKQMLADPPRGIVIADTLRPWAETVEVAQAMMQHGVPVVVYGGTGEETEFNHVVSNHEAGGYELTKWLLKQGRRRILSVWPEVATQDYWFAPRVRGYHRALEEAGLEQRAPVMMPLFSRSYGDPEIFYHETRLWGGYLIEHFSSPEPPDAIMVSTDRDFFAAAAACRLYGKTPNVDVALVGYDNYWLACEERTFEPAIPLATADKRARRIGDELAALLFEVIENPTAAPQRRVITPELIFPRP